ncbi:MAG TPA: protein kinase, partial [Gemmatimonadales bacterium]
MSSGDGVRHNLPGFTGASDAGELVSACPRCHTPLPVDDLFCSHCPPDYTHELRERLAQALEGRYEIIRLLGRGGMAAVFLAQDLALERQVAIKVLPPDTTRNDQLITRFQREAKTAAKLDHPSIIPIHRVESEAGLVYIVMKYVSGQSLEDLLLRGPLSVPQVRQILREAALALGYPRWRTSLTIVLRTALAGIVTGVLVAIARIAGETAPLLFTSFGNNFWSTALDQPIAALPHQI